MRIFSYVFYTLSKIYRAGLDRNHPDVYACGLLSCIQMFNILTVLLPYLSKGWFIAISLVVLSINTVFFNAKTLKKFDERWDNEPKPQRIFRRMLVILYVAGSLGVFLYVVL